MPAYKFRYFERTLDSVLGQTYPALELVICDDNPDGTIAAAVERKRVDARFPIRYQRNPSRLGELGSTIKGIGLAQGEYVKFLHDDDVLEPDCIAALVRAMQAGPDVALASSRRQRIDSDDAPLPDIPATSFPFAGDVVLDGPTLLSFLADHTINFIGEPSCVLCRRQDLLEIGDQLMMLDGRVIHWVGDLALYAKLLHRGNLALLARPLTRFRVTQDQFSQAGRDRPGIGDQGHDDFRRGVRAMGWYRGDGDVRLVHVTPLDGGRAEPIDLLQAIQAAYARGRAQLALRDWQARRQLPPVQRALLDARLADLGGGARIAVLLDARNADATALETSLRSLLLDGAAFATLSVAVLAAAAAPAWPDPRVRYLPLAPGEEAADRNAALAQLAHADWFLCAAAGTRFCQGGLLRLVLELAQHPQCSALYADEWLALDGQTLAPVLRPDPDLDLLLGNPLATAGHWIFHRALVQELGGFDPDHDGALELELILRLFQRDAGASLAHLPEPLLIAAPIDDAAGADARQRAVASHLQARGYADATVAALPGGLHRIDYGHALQPPVSIVVIAQDNLPALQRAVVGLLEHTAYPAYELLLVDNASTAAAVGQWLQAVAELGNGRIRVFALEQRVAQAEARNLAATQAHGDYLLFLDADNAVIQGRWLHELMNHAQRPEVGIVGAKGVSADGSITHAGLLPGLLPGAGHAFAGEPMAQAGYMGRLQVAHRYSAVSERCMLVRRALFEQLSGFDAVGFAEGGADVDLCLRAAALGEWTIWTPEALLLQPAAAPRPQSADDALLQRWLPVMAQDPAYSPSLGLEQPGGFKLGESEFSWQPLSWKPLPRILAHPGDAFGSGHYRVIQPFQALAEAGLIDGVYYARLLDPVEMQRVAADAVVVQRRIGEAELAKMERMRRFSAAFKVYELDDYLPNLPLKSVHREQMPKDVLRSLRRAASLVDRVVVSTPALAEALAGLHADLRVVRNRLDPRMWGDLAAPARTCAGSKPRVGWAGGASHTGDLELIADVVQALAGEVHWVFMGMCPPRLRPHVAEVHPGVDFARYPQALAALRLDLALAPLEDNLFNRCKSNLRLLEYGACGYPVVASDLPPYQDGLPATLVKNRFRDWINAIRMHLADAQASAAAAAALHAAVRRDWMLHGANLQAWRAAWLPD
ncbi:O-antigen biosynthesis protein [Xanthomonas theicola]|uniref:O-antigen biosynthesis protein n=2 Tax=Xanthomonas theicola TaxID=56464 RepID=A0A2S6ZEJ3_9XANT|nr:glycosyltransferase [Xanthomonas theicola]PPT90695.1 O-antigen biosynthesis protein [Xanthomonas theicola]QNH27031.1 glycosyltransferase [Xanthomonas theicola]